MTQTTDWPVPTPEEIKEARQHAGLTQAEAGAVINVPGTTWRRYETAADKSSHRPISAQYWKLWRLRMGHESPRHADNTRGGQGSARSLP